MEPSVTSTTTTTSGPVLSAPVIAVDPAQPVPVLTWSGTFLKHFQDWVELYAWAPLSILGIILFAEFASFLTGRKPLDQGFDFVGLGIKLSICVFLILLLSILRQALGVWPTKAEQVMHVKHLIWAQRAETLGMAIVFTYIITR